MLILSEWAHDLEALFFPPRCPVCQRELNSGSRMVCTRCLAEAPLTHFWLAPDNPLTRSFWGLLPVEQASALLYFSAHSGWRRLIHDFKYHHQWRLALEMGRWYGAELAESDLYHSIDRVIPIPLHWRKRLLRGYNQSEYLAQGIAEKLGVECDLRSVRRHRNNPSQAQRSREERWQNVEGIFSVRHPERLAGKHLLLVDDVLTTRATLISCGEAILKAVPDCRLSVAVLAASKHNIQHP